MINAKKKTPKVILSDFFMLWRKYTLQEPCQWAGNAKNESMYAEVVIALYDAGKCLKWEMGFFEGMAGKKLGYQGMKNSVFHAL